MHPIVLVIEDDPSTKSFLENLLTDQGFIVKSSTKGTSGLQLLSELTPDLVLLDLELPDINGESVCSEIKKQFPSLPVIMLTAKNSLSAKIQGFDIGADDYITKPFETEELLVRIKARLREKNISNSILKIGDLELDSEKIEVKRAGEIVNLTPREFELLQYLMQNEGKVISRDMILNKIWAYSFEIESRVVDVYMGYLRKKIDKDSEVKLIKSIRGFGYTIKE